MAELLFDSLRGLFVAALLSVAVGVPNHAFADPCSGAGDGDYDNTSAYAPAPAAHNAIIMKSEVVDFREAADGNSWAVKADYRFANRTKRTIRTTMIFPFSRADRYCSFVHEVAYSELEGEITAANRRELESNGFTVRLDDQEVETTFSLGVTCAGGQRYPFGYYFVTTFEPDSETRLTVEYTQHAGPAVALPGAADCPNYGVDFILETGALWRDPIGQVTMRYHLASPSAFVAVADKARSELDASYPIPRFLPSKVTAAGVPFQSSFECRDGEATVILEAKNVEPTGSVSFAVHSLGTRGMALAMQGCAVDKKTLLPQGDCCPYLDRPFGHPPDKTAEEHRWNWEAFLEYGIDACYPGARDPVPEPGPVLIAKPRPPALNEAVARVAAATQRLPTRKPNQKAELTTAALDNPEPAPRSSTLDNAEPDPRSSTPDNAEPDPRSSAADDNRATRDETPTAPSSSGCACTSVSADDKSPKPEEWLLLGGLLCCLTGMLRKRRVDAGPEKTFGPAGRRQ